MFDFFSGGWFVGGSKSNGQASGIHRAAAEAAHADAERELPGGAAGRDRFVPPVDGALVAEESAGAAASGDRAALADARHQRQLQQFETSARVGSEIAFAGRSLAVRGSDQTGRSSPDGCRFRNRPQGPPSILWL